MSQHIVLLNVSIMFCVFCTLRHTGDTGCCVELFESIESAYYKFRFPANQLSWVID